MLVQLELHEIGGVGEGDTDGDGDGETLGDGLGDADGDGLGDAPVTVNWSEQVPAFAACGLEVGTFGAIEVLPFFSILPAINTTAPARTSVRIVPPTMRYVFSRCFCMTFKLIDYPNLHIRLRYMVDIEQYRHHSHSQ